jgi:alpha-galactosidase
MFRKRAKWCGLVLIGGMLALVSVRLHAQANLTGNWVAVTPREDGTSAKSYFNLKQEGSQITGTIRTTQFYLKITGSEGAPDNFTLTASQQDGRNQRQVQYQGKLVGDELHLVTHFRPNAPAVELVAHRTAAGDGAMPARLELPALHKVPYNGLAKTPPMGWNSWNKFNRRVSDEVVRGVADAMASNGMRDAGYVYVNIDDTWEADRDANGNIQTNKKFPDMKALADYVHSKGMKLGIYSSPGPSTCAGYEGTYGHEAQDARTYAAWGIDYLKYDWCGARTIYKDDEMQPVYQKMGDALIAAGRPIVFSLCQYGRADVWKWGPDVGGNLWRTTGDISDHWDSMVKIGFNQSDLAPYAAPGHWNDPDMLEIGNGGMTDTEYRTHMSLWSMLAAPLIAGNDVRDMSPAIRDILMNHEVIAIDQDADGKQGQRVSAAGDQEIWLRPLAGGGHAIALFNRSTDSAPMKVEWSKLGLPEPPKQARDLWEHKDVSLDGPEFTTTVPGHGVVMLRVGT